MKIEKSLFEQMGGTYTEVNGYLIPNLLSFDGEKVIGVYGQRHLHYIKRYCKVLYVNLLTSGKLNDYLSDIDEQARGLFSRLVKQMSEKQKVTEQLKADNQLEWMQKTNNIRACAMEIVNKEIIYA